MTCEPTSRPHSLLPGGEHPMRVRRVAYLVGAPSIPIRGPGGASAHIRNLAQALCEDHDTRVFASKLVDPSGSFGHPVPTIAAGAPTWPRWMNKYRDMIEVSAARRVANRVVSAARHGWTPDVMIERHTLFSDAGWRVADAINVPWVLEVNAPSLLQRSRTETLPLPEFARRWEQKVLQNAPAIVTVSRWLKDWLETEIGCRNVAWVPNGVNPLRGNRERGRAALGLTPDEPAVGYVGALRRSDGAEHLEAIASGANARLVIIGNDTLGSTTAVQTGHLNPQDLADAVAAIDVGLAPYTADAPPWCCPLRVLDYRAQGTPVVGADVGETKTLTGEGGTIVPPGEVDTMIDATRYWMGRRTKRKIRSWHRVGKQLIDIAVDTHRSQERL